MGGKMLSVNTNVGAMVALQYLNKTNSDLQTTQSHINSGLKVGSPKDNGAVYAIAQNMRGNVAGYQSVADSLNRGISSIDVAIAAGQSISDLLTELKSKALAAADSSLDTASRNALDADFTALRDQITNVVNTRRSTGRTSSTDRPPISRRSPRRMTKRITVADRRFRSGVIVTRDHRTIRRSKASTMIHDQQLDRERQRLYEDGFEEVLHSEFLVSKLVDALKSGIGNRGCDMAQESAQSCR
jgi:flagellin